MSMGLSGAKRSSASLVTTLETANACGTPSSERADFPSEAVSSRPRASALSTRDSREAECGGRAAVGSMCSTSACACSRASGPPSGASSETTNSRPLERGRYICRPTLSSERLSLDERGRDLLELRRPWRDGTTHLVFEPLVFLERLAALVPHPREHLLTYHGWRQPPRGATSSCPRSPARDRKSVV